MFEFDEKTHTYTLDGKRMTGVTTILDVIAKPALIGWASKMAVTFIKDNFKGELTDELLEQARNAHRQKKEDAGDVGTDVHKAVEEWIKDKKEPELNEQGMKMFENFRNWATENNVKFLASEKQVYDKDLFYAGTLDFICEIDGKNYIGDLKTSSGIYDRSFFFQCAGYRNALASMGDETKFDGSVVVRCGKKGDFEVKYSYDYETDLKGFMACLELYRSLKTF